MYEAIAKARKHIDAMAMNLTARKLAIQKQCFLGNSAIVEMIQKTIFLLWCLEFDLGKQKEFSRLWAGENWARFLVLLNSGAGFIIIMIRWPFNCRVILYQKVEKNQHIQRIIFAMIGCVNFIVNIPVCFSQVFFKSASVTRQVISHLKCEHYHCQSSKFENPVFQSALVAF